MKPMWRSAGLLLLGLALVAAGYAWRDQRARLEAAIARQRQDSVLQAVTVQHARERARLEAAELIERRRADAAETAAKSQRDNAARYSRIANGTRAKLDSALTARDSVPLLVQENAALVAANLSLTAATDSLLGAVASLRRTNALLDSLRSHDVQEAAAREAALRTLNAQLQGEIARLQGRGKFLGIVRIPGEVKYLGALYAGCRLAGGCRVP